MISLSKTLSARLAQRRVAAGLNLTLERCAGVRQLLDSVERIGKHWAIVGGAPRNWALADRGDLNDIDIVVGMPPTMLERVILEWQRDSQPLVSIATTALGGYRLSSEAWEIDIWTVAKTVGVARGQVVDTKSYRAVARSAALSLDSIVVTSRGTVYENGFFVTVQTGILRMNHCSVERPHKVAEKALKLCKHFRVVPDISLQALIASFLGQETVEALLESGPFTQNR